MKLFTTLVAAALIAGPAAATTLRITVTNNQNAPENGVAGFALTPVYSAFHNGNFDSYDLGAEVSAGVERIAELGDQAVCPLSAQHPAFRPGPWPQWLPTAARFFGGETATGEVTITDFVNQRFFSFLSMVVPSNDTFIANGNPTAFDLFNDDGTFAGLQTINITGLQVRDAGTELTMPLPQVARHSLPLL